MITRYPTRRAWSAHALGLLGGALLAVFAAVPALSVAAEGDPKAPAEAIAASAAAALSVDNATTLLAAAKAELEGTGANPAEGSVEARIKAALQRRVALLEEFIRLAAAAQSFAQQEADLAAREKKLRAELEQQAEQQAAKQAAPQPAPSKGEVDKATLDEAEAELDEARRRANTLRETQTQARQRLDVGIQKDLDAAQKRREEATKRAEILSGQLASASDDAERRLLNLQSTNSRYDEQVAERAIAALKAEGDYERAAETVNTVAVELADRAATELEKRFNALAAQLQQALAGEQARAAAELARKEREEQRADSPDAKFLAQWETQLARSLSGAGEVTGLIIPLKKDVAEQEKRLTAEREEDATVRDLIKRSGTAGGAGERINRTAKQLQRRKEVVERTLALGQLRALPDLRNRRFEVEDLLIGLVERFNERKEEIAQNLDEGSKTEFLQAAEALLPKLRPAFRAERLALSEAIGLGTELQKLLTQRLELMRDLERFIRTRAFWLRDARPMGPEALSPLPRELDKLRSWLAELGSNQTLAALTRELTGVTGVLYGLLLFPVAPLLLFWARQKLRQTTRRVSDRVVAEGQSASLLLATMVTGFMSAALLPLYLVLASRLVVSAGLPTTIGPVLASLLNALALFLFLWFLFRSFFHRRGIAEVQFAMPKAASNSFYAGIRWLLFGGLVWLAPSSILRDPPFGFDALPALAYVLFLITASIAVVRLVRPRSAFVQHRLDALGGAWPSQQWHFVSGVFMVLMASTVVLQLLGYRTASTTILMSTLLSLTTLFVLPPLYAGCAALIKRVQSRRQDTLAVVTGETPEPTDTLADRTIGFIRFAFIVVALAALASIWGLDQQALATLDEWVIYTVRGVGDAQEFVSAGDMVRCVLIIFVTIWILRSTPGVYEFAIFPHLNLDEGIKYALLTITRYGVFVVGLFIALNQAHLDLGRLGWLMAAMGVGLGFGLQEIVSNFVSGLILLIERPVRPGDVISVGSMTGTVQRINIRATTIVNFDRQEVLVPNRSLITSDVTNWTRGDTTNRVVVLIGVAYGSDVDAVTELLYEIANDTPEALKDPAPQVFFVNHGESSLDFEVRLFVPSPKELMRVRDYVNKTINREFAERDIEIPFPQRDLHIRSGVLPLEAAPKPG